MTGALLEGSLQAWGNSTVSARAGATSGVTYKAGAGGHDMLQRFEWRGGIGPTALGAGGTCAWLIVAGNAGRDWHHSLQYRH